MAAAQTTAGSGPGYARHPDYRVDVETSPRLVRVVFGGEDIARSEAALLMRETAHTPVYYFPPADVRMDLMRPTERSSHCPFKGDASYWTIAVADRVAENAVWSYRDPYDEVAAIKDHVAFYWDEMDAWFEEDEEIFVHPRDPYKRVDAVRSRRTVEVVVGGVAVARSTNALFLFETGLPTRYYLPREAIAGAELIASDTSTRCPYKGTAAYHHLKVGDRVFDDLVWHYPEPLAECGRIKGLLCFFNERVDAILVDGKPVAKVETRWSR